MRPEQITNRRRVVEMSYEAGVAHLGSALSAIDIIEVVFSVKRPRDKFVLSNGHAASALYAVMERYGLLHDPHIGELGVHPNRNLDLGIEISTGSLGQGLPIAVGMALADRSKNIYCCVSDGECAEGSIWEALRIAHEQGLDNLRVIVNANGFDASDPVDLETLIVRFQAQGCAVLLVDGHNLEELSTALSLRVNGVPLILFAKTNVEQLPMLTGLGAHYKVLNREEYELALESLSSAKAPGPAENINDGFTYFRERARLAEIPRGKIDQLRKLCEAFADGESSFTVPVWDYHALDATKLGKQGWVIRLLRTISAYEDSSIDYFSYYFLHDDSLEVAHLRLRNYNEKRAWWWNNKRPSHDEFESKIRSGDFPSVVEEVSPNGDGPYYIGPRLLISFLQERLMANTASSRGVELSFDRTTLERGVGKFRNLVRYFIETCRSYPEEMANCMVSLGNDFWKFGRDSSLIVASDVMSECGIRNVDGIPITKHLKKPFETIQLGDGFRLSALRTYYQNEWLSPDYYLSFRGEDRLVCFREVGTKSEASMTSKQLKELCKFLSKGRDSFEIKTVFSEPFRATKIDHDRWVIQGMVLEFPEDRILLHRLLSCFINPDDSVTASYLSVSDDLTGGSIEQLNESLSNLSLTNPQEFRQSARKINIQYQVKWLVRELQQLVVSELAQANGEKVHSSDENNTRAVVNAVSYFVRACRDNPGVMAGAEILVWVGGANFFDTNVGRMILETFEDTGLIDTKAKLKINRLIAAIFRTREIQLGDQFKLKMVNYQNSNDVGYTLSFRERQID